MTTITLKSTIDVEYIASSGNDELIAHAAWVSTKGMLADNSDSAKVEGVLKFLMQNRHGTPFEHGSLTVRVHAPIKVWREWHRHRVGWSYNEESGRYKQLDPIFYVPPIDRPMIRPDHFKSSKPDFLTLQEALRNQHPKYSASEVETGVQRWYSEIVERKRKCYQECYRAYEEALEDGEDRGLARDVLGVGIYSACYCTCNPRSIMHFLELRTRCDKAKRPSRPLWEIDKAAMQLEAIFSQYWPLTYRLWDEYGRMAP